jgi:sugar phosphate isomerase/epimerase
MPQPLAIQSWCYRHWKKLPDVLTQLKNTGVSAVELCGAHANFADPAVHVEAIEHCKSAGVKIVAIGVERLGANAESDQLRFEFCKSAGIKHMSVTFAPEAMFDGLRSVGKLAEQYDMKLGIHNHGGYDWLGNPTILKYIFDRTSPRIGLYLDTAWAIDAKQNPVQMAEQFADRLHGIHIKDFIYDRARTFSDVVIGTGNLDLTKLLATLKQINYDGPTVIEYEGDVENPVPALAACVKAFRAADKTE